MKEMKRATFAGGCFWCIEPPFRATKGVMSVQSGYMGGRKVNPIYEEVCSGKTGHLEVVQITYDEQKISYKELLDIFWRQVDPTDNSGQFVDRGQQYETAIFYHDEEQKKLAENSKKDLDEKKWFGKPIFTKIKKASVFYPAEEYHQDYKRKNPIRYNVYRIASGRDKYLEKAWSDKQ